MVKVSDLGYQSKNLENIPNKEEKKKKRDLELAIQNLTDAELPSKLSLTDLPEYLQPVSGR